ncbi:hypothetical protein FA95DRAFT_709773 [Auriscalpium vulgare]|uniref:Uncharacterized protein n=1 Tax=Auriscalpium vulgare TaxID=40419 RepID=A0ACB8RB28_9AGAM|nr:hypothetical protein FA95DRAFT_709773 [Auriscalpium vulgare]
MPCAHVRDSSLTFIPYHGKFPHPTPKEDPPWYDFHLMVVSCTPSHVLRVPAVPVLPSLGRGIYSLLALPRTVVSDKTHCLRISRLLVCAPVTHPRERYVPEMRRPALAGPCFPRSFRQLEKKVQSLGIVGAIRMRQTRRYAREDRVIPHIPCCCV